MPVQVDTEWLTPVLGTLAAVGTAVGAVWIKVKFAALISPNTPAATNTLDSRGLSQALDALADHGRTLRDMDHAVNRIERVVLRNQDILEERNRRDSDFDQRIATAINKLKDKP